MPTTLNPSFSAIKRICSLLVFSLTVCLYSIAQNAIVTENLLPGNPISEWGVNSSSDFRNPNLNGYTTDISVNKGTTVHFKIDAQNGVSFTVKIYRLGYYGGMGARLKADLGTFTGVKQPQGVSDPSTGLLDCSNWSETTSWAVPSNAVSGFYIVKLQDAGGNINNIVFIVRDDASHSDILVQAPDATWQAYNGYGGNYLYAGTTSFPQGHAVKVSYNRPFFVYNAAFLTDGRGSDWYMNDSYPMIRWLERNGYDVTYFTNTDLARSGSLVLNHKIYVAHGHDEYWSKEMRDNIETARAAGVNLAFFTGNENYWKTRWENDASGKPNRIMVCYKEGTMADGSLGEASCGSKCDPNPTVWTGLWRMGAAYDAPLPENALTGQISWDEHAPAPITVPFAYKNLRFWRNTSVATLTSGQTASLAPGSLGYEYDYEQFQSTYPRGRITMSSTSVNPGKIHKLSLYRNNGTGGALVFGAGTVQWMWGLDNQHFGGTGNAVSRDMQQATLNLFADMGVQPGSKQSDLVAATASTDFTAPTSVITAPANGASIPVNSAINITGTASDAAGAVGGVEVSTDGGTTWQVATGTGSWSFAWTAPAPGNYTIKSRAYDDSGNMEATGSSGSNVVTITVAVAGCPCNIFTTQTPSAGTSNDGQALELGVKFRSSSNGQITGVRFYKSAGNTGTHIGELYSSTGTRLAQATFTNETASGWQTVTFSSPVNITANTTYVAAYFSASGNYNGTANFFTTALVNSPLTALADGTDGNNGMYKYTATAAFPTSYAGNKPNYWVDVVFTNGSTAPVANAGSNQTITLPTSSVTLDGSASTGTITSYAWTKISGPNNPTIVTPAAVTTNVTGLIAGTYVFQLSLNSGASTSQVTITVNASGGSSANIFTNQVPVATTDNDNMPTVGHEVGVKFKSTVAGNITGIRFYKTSGNTGTHIGELYSSTGTRLAQATFTNETATGWQSVLFSSPVAITANTTYTAAYFSSLGYYTEENDYFLGKSVTNGNLTAPADGTNGGTGTDPGTGQGTYKYTSAPAYPNQLYRSANYWVDVIFSTASTPPVANAGSNQTITLPTSSVTLNGNGSTGTITSYSWTRVSGPNTPTITSPNAVSTTVTGLIQGTYVFQLSLNSGASTSQVTITVNPAPPPVANAGSNQTITLPASSVTLNGNGSTGTITSYAWTLVSGPNVPSITTPNAVSTTVTGLIQGTYVFQLSLNAGASTSQVTITVNPAPPPTANAGTNQTITLPTSSVTLNGSGSTGSITDYTWSQVSGPNTPTITTPNAVSTTVTGLIQGIYVFQLSLNSGASTSQVTITVNPAPPPTANAGTNQTITLPTSSVTLNGSGSTGTITDYTWSQVSGPGTPTITTPNAVSTTVTGLTQGTYVFQLSLNSGASTSQVTITVNPAPPPVANAGSNQTITLPTSSVTLNGSGSTGTITDYTWSQVSGPGTPTITTPNAVSTTVTGLTQGTYVFQLSLNSGASTSQVTITVNPAPPPVANAGTNQTITLPTSSVTLDGSGSTGTVTDYAWSQVSGPNTSSILSPASVSTTVTGLIQGTYIFQLSVNGGVSTSQVTITVNPAVSASTVFTTQIPTAVTDNDHMATVGHEVGLKFKSSLAGYITGVRFYKTTGNTGTHIGELYSSNGTRLAQATFTGETATGWQVVSFATPVAITANTTYTAAYFSSLGNYVEDNDYFLNHSETNGPLTAPADGTNGASGTDPGTGQGTYKYTSSPAFPNQLYRSANYWVDPIFSTSTGSTGAPLGQQNGIAIDPPDSTLAYSYLLGQNYPNPANRTAKIAYSIPVAGLVQMVLYDVQGRPVRTLVNEVKAAGKYKCEVNCGELARGMYFYTMRAGHFIYTRKMVIQ